MPLKLVSHNVKDKKVKLQGFQMNSYLRFLNYHNERTIYLCLRETFDYMPYDHLLFLYNNKLRDIVMN